jgi:hypothetical protein
MLGNNAKSAKFRRIFVPFARDSNLNSIISGRYFFPENPELERKNITGIQIHFGDEDISLNNSTILQGVPTANLGSWSGASNLSFLTLYTKEGEEKLSNFPVYGLYNQGATFQRINIIPGEINIPKSYIYFVGTAAAITTAVVGFSITFFYN